MLRILIVLFVVFLLAMAFTMYRFISATHDPQVWHVDPQLVERPVTPNTYLVAPQVLHITTVDREAPQYQVSADVLAKAFDDYVIRQNKVTVVAGSPEELMITYVQRSWFWQIPDYISVKFVPLEGGASTIIIWSRSRFGYGDMGVNAARVESWLASLQSLERPAEPIVLPGTAEDETASQ
ncbi:DUF1499 domain-containing protein [Abyssibius alkaniclasticus]|uniref:DUF1499 domain-containing protein n=1 Tax=Abyssibius alkaniclasticus TaxID=2881234 RepID=UPI00236453AC|nr:DUF1499 domain-containing protein [Abyssibius alkaniclasticus]UPH70584.1 DUF1499 domain-containing protein [Abyssibius alkaniclasticus]|tara:strand:+ start:299 stop:841 length:543 start_codon:yes stop_codon:yes gene_type:complete